MFIFGKKIISSQNIYFFLAKLLSISKTYISYWLNLYLNQVGKLLGQKMVDENDFFAICSHARSFLVHYLCSWIEIPSGALQYPF